MFDSLLVCTQPREDPPPVKETALGPYIEPCSPNSSPRVEDTRVPSTQLKRVILRDPRVDNLEWLVPYGHTERVPELCSAQSNRLFQRPILCFLASWLLKPAIALRSLVTLHRLTCPMGRRIRLSEYLMLPIRSLAR